MKLTNTNRIVALLLLVTTVFTGCKKDDDPSALETSTKLLTTQAWTLTKVTVDGEDKTSIYEGLTLQWKNDNTFTSTDGGAMWPATGTWAFEDKEGKAMTVLLGNNEEADVEVVTLSKTTLIIALHWNESTIGDGRVRSIAGDHVFEFEAQ
jgi:hypothetical protein